MISVRGLAIIGWWTISAVLLRVIIFKPNADMAGFVLFAVIVSALLYYVFANFRIVRAASPGQREGDK